MSEKVLYVDDDPNILAAYKRVLRRSVAHIETALGGEEGLAAMADNGPFAVVISDMRMPGMDGIQFLSKVEEIAPDTVRMMLTGNADLQTSIDAVNEGHIFRFLTKPCPKEVLVKSVQAGIEQYRLIVAERQLLEETLNGGVTVLTDVLSLVNPTAFGRAARIRRYVTHVVTRLGLPDTWKFEVAAMLSQIGCVTVPGDILQKIYAGQELSQEEEKMYASHPDVGGRLIVNIPRLEDVAHMIARQQDPYAWDRSSDQAPQPDDVALGGQILKVVLDFDRLVTHGSDPQEAFRQLRQQPDVYSPDIVLAIQDIQVRPAESQPKALMVDELDAHMILDEDVHAENGNLLVTRGQELTFPVLERLRRWSRGMGVKEPIRVLVPNYASEGQPAEVGAAR
ncbi:MAG: HD domain-containing phosphohydrolase [Phycisphaerae bacterium]